MGQKNLKTFFKETGLFIADILYNAIVIVALVILIRSFLISPFRVVGSSMADTLQNEEFILIDKLSYKVGSVNRGDPIVFFPPAGSRDAPKFEELVTVNESGDGTFRFSDLVKNKEVSYCRNALLRAFWFCKVKVKTNDLVYFAPNKEAPGSSAKQADWALVQRSAIDKEAKKQGVFEFEGTPDQSYMIRIYDSMGPDYFVKRVIGVPGDTIKIDNGRVHLKKPGDEDFYEIEEVFLNQENENRTYISQKHRQNIYEVPEGYYFVLGDNRNHSNDSRSWLEPITQEAFAFVPEANISGKVLVVLWPITDFRLIGSTDF